MALTDPQIKELIDLNPFLSVEQFKRLDRLLGEQLALPTQEYYPEFKTRVQRSTGILAYLLQKSDELLLQRVPMKLKSLNPAQDADAVLLEVAANTQVMLKQITAVNDSPTTADVEVHHLLSGETKTRATLILSLTLKAKPNSNFVMGLNLGLKAGEKIVVRASTPNVAFTAYGEK